MGLLKEAGVAAPTEDRHWSAEEIASFAMHPGRGRVLHVRAGSTAVDGTDDCLREAGYNLGRLSITRDSSHLPEAAATFAPDVIYVSLEGPTALCLCALEALASDPKTKQMPLVALLPAGIDSAVIDDAYARAGCDFFRLDATAIELLARTHLLVRLHAAIRGEEADTEPTRPTAEAANAPVGSRLDLRDAATQLYTSRYLRHRLPTEQARAHRYQRNLSVVAVRCGAAAASDETACKLAQGLRATSRDVDLLARHEADLFVALLPETDEHGAQIFARRLEANLLALDLEVRIGHSSLGGSGEHAAYTAAGVLQAACGAADDA